MIEQPAERTWFDRGRQHFDDCQAGRKSKVNYPTQDSHTPTDEAEFVRGFQAAQREHANADQVEEAIGRTWLDEY